MKVRQQGDKLSERCCSQPRSPGITNYGQEPATLDRTQGARTAIGIKGLDRSILQGVSVLLFLARVDVKSTLLNN